MNGIWFEESKAWYDLKKLIGEVKEEERRAPGAKTYNQLSRNLKFFEFQWREQAKTTFLPFHFTKKTSKLIFFISVKRRKVLFSFLCWIKKVL